MSNSLELPALPEPDMCHQKSQDDYDEEYTYSAEAVRAYGAACAAAEREACAVRCVEISAQYTDDRRGHAAERCAAAIRARGTA
jgi:hypothetical protein